jgi:RNA polymerase sigma-70 factor (ECF subfamily)
MEARPVHLALVPEPKPDGEPTSQARPTLDTALVVAARAGDVRAREELFRRHARGVFGLAQRLLGRADGEVDDLVQESMLAAVRALPRLETPEAFPSWLNAIVVRTACKVIRRRVIATRLGLRQRGASVDVDLLISPAAPPDVRSELAAVFRCLERLPTRERVALVLRRIDGVSYDEIARLMDTSPRSAKRWVEAAEDELAIELERRQR